MTKEESKKICKENEEAFQKAWYLYWHQETTKAGMEKQKLMMWNCVYLCCENMCKSKGKGIVIPNLEEKAMDATIKVMAKVQNGFRPQKLSSYCYFPVIEQLYNKQVQKIEKELSYEAWQEWQYAEEEANAH